MKQQLFSNFWLSLSAVALGIQPAWANTPSISAVRFKPITSSVGVILQASNYDNSNTLHQISQKLVQPSELSGSSENRSQAAPSTPTPTPVNPSPTESDILNQGTHSP